MHTAPTLGVVTTDRHLAIRGWNEWIADSTGIAESRAIGRPLLDFVEPERAEFYRGLLAEIISACSARVLAPAFHHYLIKCPPRGKSEHFDCMQQRVTIAPLMAGASAAGLMITLEDVTERLDRERSFAAMHAPSSTRERTLALASEDWQVRGEAVRHLTQSASVDELRHLLDTLHRDHDDLNVLSSALRVLIGAGRTVVEPLVQLLSDDAANLRMHAALALGELKANEATPGLVIALADPDENVRFHAIEALGHLGAAESIDPLAKIATSDNFYLAFAAIDALSKADDTRVMPLMVSLLDQELLRPAAVATLAAMGDEDCVPALVRSLNEAGHEAGPIANALVKIHRRYQQNLDAGSFIVEAAKDAISTAGRESLIESARREGPYRVAAATVLSWMGKDALAALMVLLGDEELTSAIGDGIVEIGTDAVEPLIERLGSPSQPTRVAAAELLGRIGDIRSTAALQAALRDSDAGVAAAAAAALGSLGQAAAVDGLMGVLGHPSATVRRAAISAINAIGATDTAGRIRGAIVDADARVRESAIRVAGYFGFEDSVPSVVSALVDAAEEVRRAAIEQLPLLDDVDAAGRLIAALVEETPRNRAAAAHALRQIDDPRVGPALRNALQDSDSWVRYFAAASLQGANAGSGDADSLAALTRRDPATHVRIAALTSLGAIDPQLAVRAAEDLIDDPDDDLATAAVTVLGAISAPETHTLLVRAARSRRWAIQLAAVRAFAAKPSQGAVDVLEWAARVDDVPSLSEAAIDALRQIGGNSKQPLVRRAAVSALCDLAAEGRRRLEVIAAIARLPEHAVPEIASGLSAGRVGVRVAAADALAAMRHPRASSELARALHDEDASVRMTAIAGFAKLGTPAVGRTIAYMRQTDPDERVRRRAELACERHGWGVGPLGRT